MLILLFGGTRKLQGVRTGGLATQLLKNFFYIIILSQDSMF